jgi:hypothetical protein
MVPRFSLEGDGAMARAGRWAAEKTADKLDDLGARNAGKFAETVGVMEGLKDFGRAAWPLNWPQAPGHVLRGFGKIAAGILTRQRGDLMGAGFKGAAKALRKMAKGDASPAEINKVMGSLIESNDPDVQAMLGEIEKAYASELKAAARGGGTVIKGDDPEVQSMLAKIQASARSGTVSPAPLPDSVPPGTVSPAPLPDSVPDLSLPSRDLSLPSRDLSLPPGDTVPPTLVRPEPDLSLPSRDPSAPQGQPSWLMGQEVPSAQPPARGPSVFGDLGEEVGAVPRGSSAADSLPSGSGSGGAAPAAAADTIPGEAMIRALAREAGRETDLDAVIRRLARAEGIGGPELRDAITDATEELGRVREHLMNNAQPQGLIDQVGEAIGNLKQRLQTGGNAEAPYRAANRLASRTDTINKAMGSKVPEMRGLFKELKDADMNLDPEAYQRGIEKGVQMINQRFRRGGAENLQRGRLKRDFLDVHNKVLEDLKQRKQLAGPSKPSTPASAKAGSEPAQIPLPLRPREAPPLESMPEWMMQLNGPGDIDMIPDDMRQALGIVDVKVGHGGGISPNTVVTLADGTRYMIKAPDEFGINQMGREEAAAYLGNIILPGKIQNAQLAKNTNDAVIIKFFPNADEYWNLPKLGRQRMFEERPQEMLETTIFDWLVGNPDAHGGNVLVTPDNVPRGIDKGKAFVFRNPPSEGWQHGRYGDGLTDLYFKDHRGEIPAKEFMMDYMDAAPGRYADFDPVKAAQPMLRRIEDLTEEQIQKIADLAEMEPPQILEFRKRIAKARSEVEKVFKEPFEERGELAQDDLFQFQNQQLLGEYGLAGPPDDLQQLSLFGGSSP